jgi:hypothetical protein
MTKPANGSKASDSIQLMVDTGARFCITIQIDSTAM